MLSVIRSDQTRHPPDSLVTGHWSLVTHLAAMSRGTKGWSMLAMVGNSGDSDSWATSHLATS